MRWQEGGLTAVAVGALAGARAAQDELREGHFLYDRWRGDWLDLILESKSTALGKLETGYGSITRGA